MNIMKNKKRKNSVFGIFSDQSALDRTIEVLKENHFRKSDITVLVANNKDLKNDISFKRHSKAPEGISTGVLSGIIVGFILGWILGNGILYIKGLEPISEAGSFMGAIAGAGLGGTIGAILGGLVGLSVPEYEIQKFEGSIKEGGILLTVHVDDSKWEKKARRIMNDNGATQISLAFEKRVKTKKVGSLYKHPIYQEKHLTQPHLQTRVELGSELHSQSKDQESNLIY